MSIIGKNDVNTVNRPSDRDINRRDPVQREIALVKGLGLPT